MTGVRAHPAAVFADPLVHAWPGDSPGDSDFTQKIIPSD